MQETLEYQISDTVNHEFENPCEIDFSFTLDDELKQQN